MITPQTATLPALQVLQKGNQWVNFNTDKAPFNPRNGKPAKANDPATWDTYEQAMYAAGRWPRKYAGVGREFLKENGITGIDLDHCIDSQGNISDFARATIALLNSYTEYSPSGQGIHIWVYGTLPDNISPNKPLPDGIEMYDHARYFTITGKHLHGTPVTIEQRQDELTRLYDETKQRRAEAKPARPAPPANASARATTGDTPYGLKALEDECDQIARTGDGARNDQLNRSAFAIGQLIAGGEITEDTARRGLEAAADRAGLSYRETVQTLRSGIESGMKSPRRAPEKPHHTQDNALPVRVLLSPDGKPLPEVIIGGQLRDTTTDALEALRQADEKKPSIFVQSARLVQVACNEKGRPIIIQMGVAELKNALTRSANYFRQKKEADKAGAGFIDIPVSPPKEIAEAILALNPSDWPFHPLEAIVETPVMRPDGSILDAPGYDAATQLYYYPHGGMNACKVPATPTRENIQAARALIEDAIGEFPYVDQADRANAHGALLTPLVRHAIKRHVPMALIDATKQGTGKGLLADTISITATGSSSPVLTMSDSEEELQKALTSLLMEGATIITIDNVSGRLQSRHLDAVLTADMWRGRVLGQSRMVTVPQRATWLATGNNIRLGGDLARRCYRIRLDSHVSRPWMRSGFKHADLATWVTEHRAELIAALLTLARAWFVAGQPMSENVPALGTFTSWAKMIGGILEYCGMQGFLTNLEKLYDEADEESAQWETFLIAWREKFSDGWKTTADIGKELLPADSAENSADSVFVAALPDALQEALKEKPKSFSIILGKALEKRLEACFGDKNLRIEREKDSHTKGKRWRVIGDFADSADSSLTHMQREKNDETSDKFHIENGLENYPHYPQDDKGGIVSNGLTGGANGYLPRANNVKPLSASVQLSADEQRAWLARFDSKPRVTTPAGPGVILDTTPLSVQLERNRIGVVLDTTGQNQYFDPGEIQPCTLPIPKQQRTWNGARGQVQ